MRKRLRLASVLLILLLLAGLLPTAAAGRAGTDAAAPRFVTAADRARLDADVFAKIEAVINAAAQRMGGGRRLGVEDYCRLLPEVRAAVESSETYAAGTLRQNGSFLTWKTKEGFACFFDPRTEALLQDRTPQPYTESAAALQPELLRPADLLRPEGGSPSSLRVGLIQPFWDHDEVYEQDIFTEAGPKYVEAVQKLCDFSGGIALRFNAESSTIDNVARVLEDCGVAIFESHGVTDYFDPDNDDETSRANCSYLLLSSPLGLSREDMEEDEGPFGPYYHAMLGHGSAAVSGTCISRHMTKDAPHSLLYTGICSGMATDGLFRPLRERGVETVWGYSQPVHFRGEYSYMERILDGVSRGQRFADAVSDAKAELGNWDPTYSELTEEECVAGHVAFPIAVSSEDPWPGRDGVNAVQQVHSGWQLLSTAYRVQAVADDPAHGSVSVQATRITALPAEGWRPTGARVLRGSAELRQDGDLFAVSPASDCVIEIQFTQKAPVSVRCVAGGETLCTLEGLQGDPIVLPQTAPEVPGWRLVGWTAACVGLTEDEPESTAPGAAFITEQSQTLYALYGREIEDAAEVFRRLTEAPEHWEGEYVLTSDRKAAGLYVLCGIPAGECYEDYETGGTQLLAQTGIVREGDLLRGVESCFVFRFSELADGVYGVRNECFGSCLGDDQERLRANGSADGDWCRWRLSFREDALVMRCLRDLRYNVLAFSSDYGFFLYENDLRSVWLWHRERGPLRLYHSDPGAPHAHAAGEPREEGRTEPGCTEEGSRELVTRCLICDAVLERRQESVPALGHDWEAPVYCWAEDDGSVTASRSCARDPGHGETETAQTSAELVREPSETEEGELRYTAVFQNPAFETQTKTVVLPKLEPEEPFDDVTPEQYWYAAIRWAWNRSPRIANGVADRLFKPQNACTRAQIVSFLWRAAGEPEPETAADPFTDVQSDRYYYKAVLWAAERGIAFGFGDGSFRPGTGCSRAEALSFLWRYAGSPEPQTASCPFADVPEGAYYRSAVLWAAERGITVGVGSGAFRPGARCTRGQIVCFLYRLSEEPIG